MAESDFDLRRMPHSTGSHNSNLGKRLKHNRLKKQRQLFNIQNTTIQND